MHNNLKYLEKRWFILLHDHRKIIDLVYEQKYYGTVSYCDEMDDYVTMVKPFQRVAKSEEDLIYLLLKYDFWIDKDAKNAIEN